MTSGATSGCAACERARRARRAPGNCHRARLYSGLMATSRDAVAPGGSQAEGLEEYRRELTGYCYRMLGSGFEADDAVQETMLRAWRSADQFEGRSSLRSWLYRIATNVCLDMLRGRKRRALPMELGAPSAPDPALLGQQLPEHLWVSPIADDRVLPAEADPAVIA